MNIEHAAGNLKVQQAGEYTSKNLLHLFTRVHSRFPGYQIYMSTDKREDGHAVAIHIPDFQVADYSLYLMGGKAVFYLFLTLFIRQGNSGNSSHWETTKLLEFRGVIVTPLLD